MAYSSSEMLRKVRNISSFPYKAQPISSHNNAVAGVGAASAKRVEGEANSAAERDNKPPGAEVGNRGAADRNIHDGEVDANSHNLRHNHGQLRQNCKPSQIGWQKTIG